MARTKRILYDDGIYHVINRGHNRQILFKDTEDFKKFKDIMKKYIQMYNIKLYNYCLMINHFHLLLKIDKADYLPTAMKGICQSYAHHYKRKYGRIGYLFQNRYKSIPVEKDEYLSECARYIERNPIRAKIVEDLSKYPYSSYNYYANGHKDDIITTNLLYETFGNAPRQKRHNYIKYITKPRPYEALLDKAMLEMY